MVLKDKVSQITQITQITLIRFHRIEMISTKFVNFLLQEYSLELEACGLKLAIILSPDF